VPLDCKLEFLVCAKLVSYTTVLEKVIQAQAESSLSPIGNYVIDRSFGETHPLNTFSTSEHRNILYLMSKLGDFGKRKKTK
jgi:hypothetical protein